jgi:predicted ester cyclase
MPSNKEIVRRIPNEVFGQGKVEVIDEIIAPNHVEHSQLPPPFPQGAAGLRQFVPAFRAAFPDLHYETLHEIEQGDLVMQHVKGSGTMKGDFMGMPASGKSATWTEIHITRMQGGKLVEHWGVVDQLGMLTQLGYASRPGAPAGAA